MLQKGDKLPTGLKGILVRPEDVEKCEGKKVSLSSLSKGQYLVLYFYPKDLTPGCTTELQMFRDLKEEIEKQGAIIVGCSRDDVKQHCKFMSKHNGNFPLLTDDTGEITEKFGVWAKKKMYG
ncbi:MAG: peroxiredoxin, partial [Candidatus Hydrogenedentota bacterium]